ncbi:MAG: NUDIX domain-containing protein [Gammaproteobacteria bacterium]|nr:NUDIX domain-containing protein [Gammaproteobacteria bacterium]
MSNQILIRNSVKILLINDKDEILLMCADDPSTTTKDGIYHGKFWFTIGGEIEPEEEIMDAAIRELKEETGLNPEDVKFGPKVWHGEFELILCGKITLLREQFIVAHTNKTEVTLKHLTANERKVIKKIAWFGLDDIISCHETVYPVVLPKYLPNIINKNYPPKPIWIDLTKQPESKTNIVTTFLD